MLECEVFSSSTSAILCQFDCRTSVGQLHNTKLVSIEPQHPWAAGSLLPAAFLRQQSSLAAPLNASSVLWTICMSHALSRLHGVQCGMIDRKIVYLHLNLVAIAYHMNYDISLWTTISASSDWKCQSQTLNAYTKNKQYHATPLCFNRSQYPIPIVRISQGTESQDNFTQVDAKQ